MALHLPASIGSDFSRASGLPFLALALSAALTLATATPALAVYAPGDNARDLTHDALLRHGLRKPLAQSDHPRKEHGA